MANRDLELKIRTLIEGSNDVRELKDELRRLSGTRVRPPETSGFSKRMQGLQKQVLSVRGALVGLGALAVFGRAAGDSLRFENTLSKIVGLVGVAEGEVAGFKDEIEKLAPAVGKGPNELAEALFFITSAGARGQKALDILEVSAKASAAGLGETATVADLVTSAVNAYGEETLDASMATDILVAAVREGKAEASELTSALGGVLPVASELGVRFDEVSAAVAAQTRTGTDAATASTQLRAILVSLLKPAAQSATAMSNFGLSAEGLRQQIREEGLLATLQTLRREIGDDKEALAAIFPNVRALAGFLDLLGANADANAKTFDALAESTGSLNKAYGAVSDDGIQKLRRAQADLDVKMGTFNDGTLPSLIGGLSFALEKFNDLSEGVRRAAESFAEFYGGAGLGGKTVADLTREITELNNQILAGGTMVAGVPVGVGPLEARRDELMAELERRQAAGLLPNRGEPTNTPPETKSRGAGATLGASSIGGSKSATDAAKQRADSIAQVIARLKEQRATSGAAGEATEIYRLRQMGASQSTIEYAEALLSEVEGLKAAEEAQKRNAEAKQRAVESNAELLERLREEIELLKIEAEGGERAGFIERTVRELKKIEGLDLPVEEVEAMAGELFDLREAAEEAGDTFDAFFDEAKRNAQDELAGFLSDPFNAEFDEILSNFADLLAKLAAEAAAAEIFKAVGTAGGAGTEGGFSVGNLVSSVAGFFGGGTGASVNHAGGLAGQGARRVVSPAVFLNAERFHAGGIPGLRADEIPTILQRGEEVLTARDPRHVNNGGQRAVMVENRIFTSDPNTRVESRVRQARDSAEFMRRQGRYT